MSQAGRSNYKLAIASSRDTTWRSGTGFNCGSVFNSICIMPRGCFSLINRIIQFPNMVRKREYSGKPVLPKHGEKFRIEHLTPLARNLYEKLAEISTVEIDKLLPVFEKGDWFEHQVFPWSNVIRFGKPRIKKELEDELIHSVQNFSPNEEQSELGFSEPSAKVHKRFAFPYRISAPHAIRMNLRLWKTKKFFRRHSTEGLLLLFASPPQDLMNLADWESERIHRGLLKKGGGVTSQGIEELRRIYNRNRILSKIRYWESMRGQ